MTDDYVPSKVDSVEKFRDRMRARAEEVGALDEEEDHPHWSPELEQLYNRSEYG